MRGVSKAKAELMTADRARHVIIWDLIGEQLLESMESHIPVMLSTRSSVYSRVDTYDLARSILRFVDVLRRRK